MPAVTEHELCEITDAIVRCANPVKVILFGSQVRGTTDENSDVDLLVIDEQPFSPRRSRRRAIAAIRQSLPRIGIPVDVLLFDETEIAKWSHTTNHIIADALREGRVLHERS